MSSVRSDAGALTLLASALGVTGLRIVASSAHVADRWRGPLGTADALGLTTDAAHRLARLQVLRRAIDRHGDGRWAIRLSQARSSGLVGPRGIVASPDARIDPSALLASWPHPRVLRRLFQWCDGRRVDARLAARWPGAARDLPLDPPPAAIGARLRFTASGEPAAPAEPMARDALDALRQALALYQRLLEGRRPSRRRLDVTILSMLDPDDLPPPSGPGDEPGEGDGPRPPGGTPADAPAAQPQAAQPSDAPMADGHLGPTGEVAAIETPDDDEDLPPPPAGATVMRLAGADDDTATVVRHDEWDARRQAYLRRWTTVHERRLRGTDLIWRDGLRDRFPLLTQQIRRRFTRLAADALRRERRLPDGEIVDLDAAIDAAVARRGATGTVEDRLYATRVRRERDVSVALLIDMSGSTSFQIPPRADARDAAAEQAAIDDEAPFFWQVDHRLAALDRGPRRRVIDVVKDAAGLLCEALHALGDRHAIWAFSGDGRDRVDFAQVKAFDEPWGPQAAAALAAVEPQGSTRTGAAVRHALRRLRREPARRRVLIVLSDGYPQDRDYGPDPDDPEHGLQDTAHALREAERAGVATFNLSVDAGAHDYLRRMCPRNRYWVVDEVDELPARMLDLYRLMAV